MLNFRYDQSDVKDKKYVCLCFLFSLPFSDRYCPQVLKDLPHMSQEIEILFLIINTQLTICNTDPNSILRNTLCFPEASLILTAQKIIKLYLIIH